MVKDGIMNILRDAKDALIDIRKNDFRAAINVLDHLISASDEEIEQLLHKAQVESEIKESKILFFDTVKKAREIKFYALKAESAIIKGNFSSVKRLLKRIVEIEKKEVDNITKINKIVLYKKAGLWDKLVLETSFILFTRDRLQPFASEFAAEIDAFFTRKNSLEKMIRKKLPGYRFLAFKEELKKKVTEKQQPLLEDDSLANELKHPMIVPYYEVNSSFRKIFHDYLYIAVLGIMSYSFLTKNFFHLAKKPNIIKKMHNFYAKLAFDFDSDYDILVIEIKKITSEIKKLNKKMGYLITKASILTTKKAIKELAEEYGRFLVSADKKLNQNLDLFEIESLKLHDAIAKYVIREREKLQDILERAEIR